MVTTEAEAAAKRRPGEGDRLAEQPGSSGQIGRLVETYRPGYGLLGGFYRDEALYAHKLDRIWRQGWIFAGHGCQIPLPGDFLTLTLDTDPLLEDGQVRAFYNVCTHRGTVLCDEERGVTSSGYRPGPLSRTWEYNLDAFLRWYPRQL